VAQEELLKDDPKLEELKTLMDKAVGELLEFYAVPRDYSEIVYTDWSAQDVLGHLVMWHESFARNLDDLRHQRVPRPLRGTLGQLNEAGVAASRGFTVAELTARMRQAHAVILEGVTDESVALIPYRRGARDYSRYEHLEVVWRHVRHHLDDVRKHYGRRT